MSRVCIQSSAWLTQTFKRSTGRNILSSMKFLGFPPLLFWPLLCGFKVPRWDTQSSALSTWYLVWILLSEQGGHLTFEICPHLHILWVFVPRCVLMFLLLHVCPQHLTAAPRNTQNLTGLMCGMCIRTHTHTQMEILWGLCLFWLILYHIVELCLPQRYFRILTPRTNECDYIWK